MSRYLSVDCGIPWDSQAAIHAAQDHTESEKHRARRYVLLEILQGAQNDGNAANLQKRLAAFQVVPMLSPGIAVKAAENFRRLRAKGITIRKTADLIIGTYCMEHGHRLLHADRDFDPMAEHLGLRIA